MAEKLEKKEGFCLVVFGRGRKDSRRLLWRDFGHCIFSRGAEGKAAREKLGEERGCFGEEQRIA